MILDLAYYGDPVLRENAKAVKEITPEIKELVQNMIDTMNARNGIGLAATQVRKLHRIFVIRPYNISEDGKIIMKDVQVFINPKLFSSCKELECFDEGCLSVPGIYASVRRPKTIKVKYQDIEGQELTEEFGGLEARIIMHENDHLNGILFVDRTDTKTKDAIKSQLFELEKEQ